MHFSVPEMKRIQHVPHQPEYGRWRQRLDLIDRNAYSRIHARLNERFDDREVDTSSWMPGSDWNASPFQPIYEACGQDQEAAALFFGLLVWQVAMDRTDHWSFGRYERDGMPIKGMTYFRINRP